MHIQGWLWVGLLGCIDCSNSSPESSLQETVGRAHQAINGYTISVAALRNPTLCSDYDPIIATVLQNGVPVTQPNGLYIGPNGSFNWPASDGIGAERHFVRAIGGDLRKYGVAEFIERCAVSGDSEAGANRRRNQLDDAASGLRQRMPQCL